MSTDNRPLIGPVFEHKTSRTTSAPSPRFSRTPETGFPTAQHRSKSAFSRARNEANLKGNVSGPKQADVSYVVSKLSKTPPPVASAAPIIDSKSIPTDTHAMLRQIHEENTRMIAGMSSNEIEQEKRAILQQLGGDAGQLLRRVQEVRQRKEAKKEVETRAGPEEKAMQEVKDEVKDTSNSSDDASHKTTEHIIASPIPRRTSDGLATKPGVLRVKSLENLGRKAPSPLPATSSTRPSSRTGRKLRFAEVTPDDIHVYESAPISPKRPVFALPPPPDTKDDSIISLGTFHKDVSPSMRPHNVKEDRSERTPKGADEPEEGTPEHIRRRHFPDVPANDASLAWMKAPSTKSTGPSDVRFDFYGVPILASLSAALPSNLELRHHTEGSRAGYTIDDIFLLARSTVPAQRALMLGILAKIANRLGRQARQPDNAGEIVFAGQEIELRKRILTAGLAAIDQIGSLGARAVEVVWECIVQWDGVTNELESAELTLAPDVVSSLQLEYLLPQITDVLSHAVLPSESLAQLLAVLHWLAQQSNQLANMITSTPRLISTILDSFLLKHIPPKEESTPPDPLALQLLITLASASRSNASILLDPADALLRFVVLLPPSSPYPLALNTTLLTHTLRLYATLASYGLYSHIATTASQKFHGVASYILSIPPSPHESASDSPSRQLRIAWISLIEAWTICATDPHATSPPHEILWSQVCAWGWAMDVRKFRGCLDNDTSDWSLYAATWDAEAAWLEGARINGIKGGEEEREKVLQVLRGAFAIKGGTEFGLVQHALEAVRRALQEGAPATKQDGERVFRLLASASGVLASALRLWLACLPPLNDGATVSTPPFPLPFSQLSALSAMLVKHSIWSLPSTFGAAHLQVYLRPVTRFLIHFHRVSRHIPGTSPQLWFAQALVFLSCLLPGDETHALPILNIILLVTPHLVGIEVTGLPQGINVNVLRPFLEYAIRPERESYVAPLRPTTESISRTSTLRLPLCSSQCSPKSADDDDDTSGPSAHTFSAGLPLSFDFLFTPLTHLLRSGTSPVFRALPDNWAASEVDIVRAMLLLALAARRVLIAHGLEGFVHSAAEVVFACMRVCMLEHGVGVTAGETGVGMEVFRDAGVERLMALSLEPFTARSLGRTGDSHTTPPRLSTLEDASRCHLGATPFYQFYTDLVALYGAVSFGHPIFAGLVVTPLAMHYAVDYRRALWCGGDGASSGPGPGSTGGGAGLGDVVRSVRIPIEDVVCTVSEGGDPREYLYPIERDVGVLYAYLAALVARDGGGVEGFLRLVAVHHVACTLWRDLDVDAGTGEDVKEVEAKRREETRARLLRVLLVRGDADVVRSVVLYRQRSRAQGSFVWPPKCYQGGEEDESTAGWREERLAFTKRATGDSAAERLSALLI